MIGSYYIRKENRKVKDKMVTILNNNIREQSRSHLKIYVRIYMH